MSAERKGRADGSGVSSAACIRCSGRGTVTYFPPRRDGAYPITCPTCKGTGKAAA